MYYTYRSFKKIQTEYMTKLLYTNISKKIFENESKKTFKFQP